MPATPSGSSERFLDTPSLMAIKNMELRAKIVVEGYWNGLHRSPYHGFSVEFSEYRQYTPGDDTRYLDWRLLGRSDRYYIKKFEDETNLRCHLVVDNSRSMEFASGSYSKADYAKTLAATIGYFLSLQGDAVGLLTFDEGIREYLPARNRPGHLRQLMLALEKPAGGKLTSLEAPFTRLMHVVRRRGMIVILSDFLSPLDTLEKSLGGLAAWGHEVVVFQILDPAETTFSFAAPALFFDLESGRDLYIDPAQARAHYLRQLADHNARLAEICRKHGVALHVLQTDRPLHAALTDFIGSRNRDGRSKPARG